MQQQHYNFQTNGNASISWDGTALTTSAPITGVLNVVDAGGDGSLAYVRNTLTYTGPSASEVQAHAGAGLRCRRRWIHLVTVMVFIHTLVQVMHETRAHFSAGAGLTYDSKWRI